MIVFDGRKFTKEQKIKLKDLSERWQTEHRRKPKVAFVLVGKNPSSELYVKQKQKLAQELSVEVLIKRIVENKTKEEIKKKIIQFSKDAFIDGITVQLPLPEGLKKDTQEILDAIAPEKDIDGLTTASLNLLIENKALFLPAVARAVLEVMEAYKIKPTEGVFAVVGAKGWVGKRMALVLKNNGAEVLEIDLGTEEKLQDLRKADTVISCTGSPGIIMGDYLKNGVKAFDLGVMIVEKGEPKGDLDFESVKEKASFITPVPGGIGPVTVASLFANLLEKCL
jgi:methylenetetrahydrofolate dehydrogenase (NADP+)/methenyltetrahydrofolate cyclohydrolase